MAGAWGRAVAQELRRRSPTSLKITHRHLRRARELDLRGVLVENYRMAERCLAAPDLYEGVRAVIVDKDNKPRWRPASHSEVTAQSIDAYFAPLGAEELVLDRGPA